MVMENNQPKKSNAKPMPLHSRVYTDRPAYADFNAPRKFMAIEAIIAKRLIEHPRAMLSYSGGSDSDILMIWWSACGHSTIFRKSTMDFSTRDWKWKRQNAM